MTTQQTGGGPAPTTLPPTGAHEAPTGLLPAATVDAYLRRIGADRPDRADAHALSDLHVRHLRGVPFENLSIHLGEPVVLDERALVDKVVERRRGGFCYEVNTAFAALLRSLGFQVSLLQGRVFDPAGRPGIPYDHMALLVLTEDGRRWLADVGFGEHSHHPLAYDERGEQKDPAGTFLVRETAEGDLDVLYEGKPQYRLETRPRELADFAAGAWYHQTSPASHFTGSLVCSRLTEDGRVTLSGTKLITRSEGRRTARELDGEEEVRTAYRDLFGIVLDALPVVRNPSVKNLTP